MALVDPIATVNAAWPGALNPQREIADLFVAAQLVEVPEGKVSGFGFYRTYQHFCAIHYLTPISDGAFGSAIRRAFPASFQAAWPTDNDEWLWVIEGVTLANADTTRELLFLLTPLVSDAGVH